MLRISLENPIEVIIAVAFVVVAFAAFIGTFVFAISYVYSNVFEKWPEYSTRKRLQVSRNILITITVIAILAWLSANH